MPSSNCCFLTCIRISQEASQVVWYSHLLKNFPLSIVIHTVKSFGIVNKAEIDFFSGSHLLFQWPSRCWQFDLCSSAFSKSSLDIWKFTVHVLLKPGLENFEHYFASVWDECNCVVVWTFFGIAFLWDWNENWPFPVLWPRLSFQNCWQIECSTFTARYPHSCPFYVWTRHKEVDNSHRRIAHLVKNVSAMQETWVQFLGWEDPLENGMATHFSNLTRKIPWTEEPDGLQSMVLQRIRHDWASDFHFTSQDNIRDPPPPGIVYGQNWD